MGVCIWDPKLGRCARPYHSTGFFDAGGAHNEEASRHDVNDGLMNGFVRTVRRTGSTCTWTASSNQSWITITAGASGTGSGTVRITVARNNGNERNGTLTIAGRTAKVEQEDD